MPDLFFEIVNLSICAGWVVLFLVLLRPVLLKAPGWIRMALWGAVVARLLVPAMPESILSLLPSGHTVTPDLMTSPSPSIDSGVPVINELVNSALTGTFTHAPGASANPLQLWGAVAAAVWIVGAAAMLGYVAVSYLRLHRQVGDAVPHSDGVFFSERIASPFLLGLRKPKIYLPYFMDDDAIPAVLAHERAHIRRKDHWWKLLGFVLLSIHWFNPLMWVAYILLCRDIEVACDEKAIRDMDKDARADYAQALLSCATGGSNVNICPVAFGEVNVKTRIMKVLNYTKPGLLVMAVAVVICAVVAVCLLTNPLSNKPGELKERTLSESEKEKILQAYGTSFDELRWGIEDDSYYGNYDGYDIFLITEKRVQTSTGNITYVSNESFGHRYHEFDLYGYQNGEIHPLRWLCNEGLVSKESVKALSQINDLGKPTNLPALPDELKTEVEKVWSAYCFAKYEKFNWIWKGSGKFDENTVGSFEYICSVEGYDLLYFYPGAGMDVLWSFKIGEYPFKFGCPGHAIYAFKGDTMYPLDVLYEDGKISEESIEALFENHKQKFPIYYIEK